MNIEELGKLRKPLYGISLTIGILGNLLSLILFFFFYSSLGTLEVAFINQIEAMDNTLLQLEESVTIVETEFSILAPAQISDVGEAVHNQRNELNNLKQNLVGVFSTLRLIVIFLTIIINIAFAILSINSIAGLLDSH